MEEFYFYTEGLTVGYEGVPLIKHIEIRLKRGEILTLIGPNGAGKTTILKSIIRQLAPLGGVVCLDGKRMQEFSGKELSRKLSVVLTERVRPELMTCEDVVATGRYPYTGRLGILTAADERKVEEAVGTTDGQTILYGGVPVLAVFHSSSAGLTRGAGEVWMNALPYLQPVDSPEPADSIPNYYSRVEFTAEEFREKFLTAHPEAVLEGEDPSAWIGDCVVNDAGSVHSINIAGITITGAEKRFGSCSAKNRICFSWRLMAYPEEAIDYVVVHELAHIRHKDHSKRFYAFVEEVLPDWRERRRLLRE